MDWVIIGTLATIVAATATAIQAWVVWKKHRLEEVEQLNQSTRPSRPAPTLTTPTFPTTYSPPPISISHARMNLASEVGADYTKLRDLLVARKYKKADQETLRMMLFVSRREKEGYLDTKAIENFPYEDLRTINQLWVQNSNGRFGFSIQKEIYNSVGKDYVKFGNQVEWCARGKWKMYDEFIFEMRAPKGHLPALSPYLDVRPWPLGTSPDKRVDSHLSRQDL